MRFAWSRGFRVFSQSRFYVCGWWPYTRSVENSTDRLSILDLAMLVADETQRHCRRSLSLVVTTIAFPWYIA